MKLKSYQPQIYEDNAEMTAIALSEDTEFDSGINVEVKNAFHDNFILNATEQGVENYEALLNIIPDKTTETIEFRKERVLNRLVSHIPFTEKYLQQKLNIIIGANTNADFTPSNPNNTYWYYIIDYNNYTLDIYITQPGRAWLAELYLFCEKVIPCNIVWTIHTFAATWSAVKEHYDTWQEVKDDNSTWQDVLDGEWTQN